MERVAARTAPVELASLTGLTPLSATTGGADSQEIYDVLRARWGVVAPVDMEPGVPAWLVMGHAEICEITRNEAQFSRDPRNWRWHYDGLLPNSSALLGISPRQPRSSSYHHDGEKRRRLREPLDDGLASLPERNVVAQVEEVTMRLIDGFGPSGEADLVQDWSKKVGFLAVTALFGFDPETADQMMADSAHIMDHTNEAAEARNRMGRNLMAHVLDRRATGGDDLTAAFVRHPSFHDDGEVADSMSVPLIAASEFLTAWIALTLRLLLTDTRFAARWTGGRIALDDALDEVLWREAPAANPPLPRYAMQDLELDGKLVRKGDALIMAVAAANQDPSVHTGDLWDEVGNRAHLAWGVGPHRCPASRQARIIARVAINRLLTELDLELAVEDHELSWVPSPWVRHPQALPVRYQRARSSGTEIYDF
ncbi:cytochrome P450 [Promicromonospora citrea]|uniref:Cytochrome P450 n=1 Tax=Promicromonospora citrea TaxID=43677 RepID=A0A8H9GER4_9MICO|nr:cytochrome P450 [Promicromonospora citrea]NNH54116.1 cytochrome P450 [Promicromonospora citrea]GGM17018.1 cytochrome P450 [Promicromonospora citrea]